MVLEAIMGSEWQLVSFPVILPWREEFWTLPLYFPDLKVGVIPGWPPESGYQGLPLPPEAETLPDLKHYTPGDVRQWRAFEDYRRSLEGEGDLVQAIRNYGAPSAPDLQVPFDIYTLAWQLEKMQADQEDKLQLVDQGQEWLREILAPEPWEEQPAFGPVPGVAEMVDPEVAKLRYALWLRVMAPYLEDSWSPLLLGRTSRSLFLALRGWPEWTKIKQVQIPVPGCRSAVEFAQAAGASGKPAWLQEFRDLLSALLTAAAASEDLEPGTQKLREFVASRIAAHWPSPPVWNWEMELWAPADDRPVLCWRSAGVGILPG
jgi:hypothetical protein